MDKCESAGEGPQSVALPDNNDDLSRMAALESRLASQEQAIQRLETLVSKSLYETSQVFKLLSARLGRPYYCLDDGWALTHLDTGQPFFVNTRDRTITPWILMGGHWETNVEKVLCSYLGPDMCVIDIGAHFGYYTVKLGTRLGPTGQLICFEPNPEMNVFCEENIKINGLGRVTRLHKFALGNERGTARLTFSRGNMASANLLGDQDADHSFFVEVHKLDDVIAGSPPIDLIKLDAEGYEPMILEGAQQTLARSPRCAIMLELNLGRWERFGKIEDIHNLIRGDKIIFAVTGDGHIQLMELRQIRDFLITCAFTENYFLFSPDNAECLARIKPLII